MKINEIIDFLIINYNTKNFVNILIQSIKKQILSFDYRINIFDNSNEEKFELSINNIDIKDKINIIDNYQNNIIDFNSFFKINNAYYANGSVMHCYSVDWFLKNSNYDYIILLDSDTIVKSDIDFINFNDYVTIGEVNGTYEHYDIHITPRIMPYLQFFNNKLIKKYKIDYFNKNKMYGINNPKNYWLYDTGCYFYEQIVLNNFNYKQIQISKYINHFGTLTGKKNDNNDINLNENIKNFLKQNEQFYI